jgi:hypothetical protein
MLPGFVDVVSSTHAIGSWHTGSLASHADELAAMPSLHMAWAGWCAMVVWAMTARRWLRGLALLHVAATAAVVISTGNHFVLDLLGGAVVLAVAAALIPGWQRLCARARGPAATLRDRARTIGAVPDGAPAALRAAILRVRGAGGEDRAGAAGAETAPGTGAAG